jgi:hypothetical protein
MDGLATAGLLRRRAHVSVDELDGGACDQELPIVGIWVRCNAEVRIQVVHLAVGSMNSGRDGAGPVRLGDDRGHRDLLQRCTNALPLSPTSNAEREDLDRRIARMLEAEDDHPNELAGVAGENEKGALGTELSNIVDGSMDYSLGRLGSLVPRQGATKSENLVSVLRPIDVQIKPTNELVGLCDRPWHGASRYLDTRSNLVSTLTMVVPSRRLITASRSGELSRFSPGFFGSFAMVVLRFGPEGASLVILDVSARRPGLVRNELDQISPNGHAKPAFFTKSLRNRCIDLHSPLTLLTRPGETLPG